MGILGQTGIKHPEILDAELETGLGKAQLKEAAPEQIEVSLFWGGSLLGGESWEIKRILRLGGLVIVEVCMHKFGDICKSVVKIFLCFMKF